MLGRIKKGLRGFQPLRNTVRMISGLTIGMEWSNHGAIDVEQKALVATWLSLFRSNIVLAFDQVGFKVYSGDEEDGLLLYIFSLCGTTNRTVVEISVQDGRECMAANLIIHHRWRGFLFDGDPVFVESGRRFFAHHPATRPAPPQFEMQWFTRDNVNSVLRDAGVPEEVDLLSLDIDGVDLHIWRALNAVRPRVFIGEFNNAVPSHRSITVPYRSDFDYRKNPPGQQFFRSASLAALVKVSRAKGYRLVAVNALAYNGIFLREDVGVGIFPEIEATVIDAADGAQAMRQQHWEMLRELAWEEI